MPEEPRSAFDFPRNPQIDNIEILDVIAEGGSAIVFKARQREVDRIVAVKVLSPEAVQGERNIQRFRQEAKLTSSLDHPNIVKTIACGVSKDAQPFIIMEYIEGRSLFDEFERNGRMSLAKFKNVFLPILAALDAAHNAGLIHRDIKPGNIMLTLGPDGRETPKLVDFGIAKESAPAAGLPSQNLTKTGVVLGSPNYMSPEQCGGKLMDGRSDIYSLSCVMYEALVGEPPFTGETPLDVMSKHANVPPPTVNELSRKIDIQRELAAITLWGLAKNPDERPQTASAFAEKLRAVLDKLTLDTVPRLKSQGTGNKSIVAGLFAVVAVCVGIIGLQIHQSRNPEKTKDKETVPKQRETAGQEKVLRNSLVLSEKRNGPNHPAVLTNIMDLAAFYTEHEEYRKGQQYLERAVALYRKSDNCLQLTRALYSLGVVLNRLNEKSAAKDKFRECFQIRNRTMGACYQTADAMFQLGGICRDCGNLVESESWLKQCVTMRRQIGISEGEIAAALDSLAQTYLAEHKYDLAESTCKEIEAIDDTSSTTNGVFGLKTIPMSHSMVSTPKDGTLKLYLNKCKQIRDTIEAQRKAAK